MKTKIISALICLALGYTLTGCKPAPAKPTYPDIDDTIFTEDDLPSSEDTDTEPPASDNTDTDDSASEDTEDNGFDADDAVEAPSPTGPPPIEPPVQAAKIDTLLLCTVNGLNVRRGAGTSFATIGSLDKGDMVMPISKSGGWYKIWYLGASAYVSAKYVTEAPFAKSGDAIENVITEGKKLLGIPYVYGAQRYHFGNGSLNSAYDGKSYDCSSLMQYIFKIGANINLAMTSREQSLQGKEIQRKDIRRGDLLFFTNAKRFDKIGLERIGHVALYLGDNIILHTASDHAVIEPISDLRSSYYITARRLIDI